MRREESRARLTQEVTDTLVQMIDARDPTIRDA